MKLLRDTTIALASFLGTVLPKLNPQWWDQLVRVNLSEQQIRSIDGRGIAALSGLDLAALLKIFDRNWTQISQANPLNFESRNYLKEMMSVRNRWAHLSSEDLEIDDIYRDVDTLHRFASLIGADADFLSQISLTKAAVLRASFEMRVHGISADHRAVDGSAQTAVVTSKPSIKEPGLLPADFVIESIDQPMVQMNTGDFDKPIKIGIVGCVKSHGSGAQPARDLFTSALFRGRVEAVSVSCDSWFILSSKYGLISPDVVIAPYNVSLATASIAERRRWAAMVIEQFKQRLPDLEKCHFEIHASSPYVDFGLVDFLRLAGAAVSLPVAGLRRGEQLAHYSAARKSVYNGSSVAGNPDIISRPINHRPPFLDHNRQLSMSISDVKETGIFVYRWPTLREEFFRSWEYKVETPGGKWWIRHGLSYRDVFGKKRVHSVTFVDRAPLVEGAESDDYLDSHALVSVVKTSSRKDARTSGDVSSLYFGFDVVWHNDEITGPNSRSSLAVKIKEDDLGLWALHGLIRLHLYSVDR